MNRIILDTNCVLSYLKNRDQFQFDQMLILFEKISNLQLEATVIGHVISELVFVLSHIYSAEKRDIQNIVTGLLRNPGIHFEQGFYPKKIFEFWPDKIKDYGDAVIASAAFELKLEIVTFDSSFHKNLSKLHIKSHLIKPR